MTIRLCCLLLLSVSTGVAHAGTNLRTNPPSECKSPDPECPCKTGGEVGSGCIKVSLDMGATTPWTDSRKCALKVFADDQSPLVFTPESLHAVLGYTFKRIGNRLLPDKATPKEVVFSHPDGESVRFVFEEGESLGRPDPGFHVKMDERLQMVDAQGWACTNSPVYYDLYETDGTVRRFLATDMTNERGRLISITDARGRRVTPSDMGIDVVLGPDGVRQFLTPSRLADVTVRDDGYDVAVYPLQDSPAKDAATGLYPVPSAVPVKRLSVRSANGGSRAVVSIRSGDDAPKTYLFDYIRGDWSLTRPSGMREMRDRSVKDSSVARTVKEDYSRDGELLVRSEYNYVWKSWGFAATNRIEGFGGATRTAAWTYCNSGNGKGCVATELKSSGLRTEYAYDAADRMVRKTRSGPGMMVEVTTYAYESVDPSDVVPPTDTRPRTIVKTLDGIECERTYYVYSALTDIVERVGTQGAAYGGTNALRTVTTYYPVTAGASVLARPSDGLVQSIRHEDGKLDLYNYVLSSNTWVRTVTHLHEQSPSPVGGKTTRDVTLINARGEVIETRTEAYIDGMWYNIARNRMTYNAEGKRTSLENLAGQVTTTAWDCCHKVSETEPDGSTTTWDYDDEGRIVAASKLIPLDMTNVTWLTTCYEYDDLGRQTAIWQTNYTAQVGLPATRTHYDALGRVVARIDTLGNTTTTIYSPEGRIVSVLNPNTSTRITTRSADGDLISITGSAVTPEFHTYGIDADGTRWSRTVQGETASSPRFTKRYKNLLGQTVREERSGFRGATLATVHAYDPIGRLISSEADYEPTIEYTYDPLGNRVSNTRVVGRAVSMKPPEWRKTESASSYVLLSDTVWLTRTNIVSCSDATIVPLVTSSARQLSGLTVAIPSRSRTTDVRGNVTVNETLFDSALVTTRQTLPYATNKPLSISLYGINVQEVSVSAVTNSYAYDALGRQIAHTDGRGNTKHTEYNKRGQRSASIDALGNRTVYAYDRYGNLTSVTDPLGHATLYEYDLRGRKTYEGGATYPVRYTYDVFGNKTTMMTYRNESLGQDSGDITTWLYDEASNCMTNKVYADGLGPKYEYDAKGNLTKRIWARGVETFYAYDGWGNLTNTSYSDSTPTVSLVYDAMGRQTNVVDAAGVATFTYDNFGSQTREEINGIYSKNIVRHYDAFGRADGYTSEGIRRTRISYEAATGRISGLKSGGVWFDDHYLAGTDLRDRIKYGNSGYAYYTYETNRNILAQVRNEFGGNIISQYDYVCDAIGSRVQIARSGMMMSEQRNDTYGYNARGELISAGRAELVSAAPEYDYQYDNIGNRLTSSELATGRDEFVSSAYVANNLNQYTTISNSATSAFSAREFSPVYDDDGNQTLVQTSTGIWQVQYNGENRPISWANGATNITIKFDRMGRRVGYVETVGSDAEATTNVHHRFVYDGYLCIQRLDASVGNGIDLIFAWDPADPIATRPLMIEKPGACMLHVTHDGNKNVSDLVLFNGGSGVAAHYEYAPFGAVTVSTRNSTSTPYDFRSSNPFRFSSEYADDTLGLVYYNMRHYDYFAGRWLVRDLIGEQGGIALYGINGNFINMYDKLGESAIIVGGALIASVAACAYPQFKTAFSRYDDSIDESKKSSDKFKHCWVSCRISKTCGATIMEFAGLGKEIRDRAVAWYCESHPDAEICEGGHGDFWDSIADLDANHECVGWESYVFGVIPIGGWVGALFRESCEDCCRCRVGYK